MTNSLEGRSIVVTGGGTGLGAACARIAAREGAAVTICGRTVSKLDAIAEAIRADGGRITAIAADVTVEADVQRLVSTAVDFGGGALHGVVANAGGGGALAPLHLQSPDEFMRVLQLNVVGTLLCVKHSVPHLAAAGGGSFVAMSSIAGHVTHPFFGAYTAGKAGVDSLIRNAADEYGKYKVRFNAVQPGFISTEMMEGIRRGGPIWNSYVDQTPLGGVGEPDDVAHLVRFLLSDESRWVTGTSIPIDGGHFLRRGPDFTATVERLVGADRLDPRSAL
ncbi:MAG: SDR family NAD(P)-dependent oxidoreductase [Acidimicrobiia bacterium]